MSAVEDGRLPSKWWMVPALFYGLCASATLAVGFVGLLGVIEGRLAPGALLICAPLMVTGLFDVLALPTRPKVASHD